VKQQLIVLFPGGFSIVAGHADLHIRGNHRALERFDLFDQIFGHPGGVGSRALGHGDGNGREVAAGVEPQGRILVITLFAIANSGAIGSRANAVRPYNI